MNPSTIEIWVRRSYISAKMNLTHEDSYTVSVKENKVTE